jgi:hypothetical protein
MSFTSKRGESGWAMAIFLLSFVGLGPLIALLGLLSAAGSPLETQLIDPYQRQCPNCGGYKVNGRRPNTKTNVYSYLCDLCGYRWSWRKGAEPWPDGHVRPDLIAKGEQKL